MERATVDIAAGITANVHRRELSETERAGLQSEDKGGCNVRVFPAVILTAIVTAAVTWIGALAYRDETFARIIWDQCPQLIIEPHDPERSFIKTDTGGYIPIRPRAPKPKD